MSMTCSKFLVMCTSLEVRAWKNPITVFGLFIEFCFHCHFVSNPTDVKLYPKFLHKLSFMSVAMHFSFGKLFSIFQ